MNEAPKRSTFKLCDMCEEHVKENFISNNQNLKNNDAILER